MDEIIEGVGSRKLRNRLDLIETDVVSRPKDVPLPDKDANWEGGRVRQEGDGVAFVTEDEAGQIVPAPTETGGLCEIRVTDAKLRRWVAWLAEERLASGKLPDRNWLQNLAVPDDLNAVFSLLERYEGDSARGDFDDALAELDAMVAEALGLDDDQLSHILEAFKSDMLLKNVSPQWRHYSKSVEN